MFWNNILNMKSTSANPYTPVLQLVGWYNAFIAKKEHWQSTRSQVQIYSSEKNNNVEVSHLTKE